MNKLLFLLSLISISWYSTTSQLVNSNGGLNIPNLLGKNSPANILNEAASNIPIPNFFGNNNNPIGLISGGGGVSNLPIPNIFGNNKPVQQTTGGGGSNNPAPNVVISNNPASSLPSFNLPQADYERLSALLAEIQPLMNLVVQELQQQRLENIPELNRQSGIIVALLLQVRAMLQNELQTLLCSPQTPIVISMEIQITTLLGQVNTALTLTAQQVPENSNQALPVRSVLSLIEVGQISSAPSILNYICSLFNKGQSMNL
ncbi:uncharacterized protein [Chelonus insularis]|uniref:uncharacterized protein n=1 Tax=Chelonus insularis TaxID=460826 RepID=UPI00158B6CC1|nr:uncharacterized protein LOC118073156 [Chelonus insularis]